MVNRPYKIKREHFDEIYFTSDQHYCHNPSWQNPPYEVRGFTTIIEHDEWLNEQYSKVSDKSLIISLGDPVLNGKIHNLLNLFNKTSAPILHIWGNHFSADYALYKYAINEYTNNVNDVNRSLSYEIYPFNCIKNQKDTYYNFKGATGISYGIDRLNFLGNTSVIQIDNQLIHISHYAPQIWTRNSIACFGHSHGELDGANPTDYEDGKKLDCGVENSIKYNGTAFFTYEDIMNIMQKKNDKSFDLH